MSANHLILNGYMATGKSTVGRIIADALDLPFVDIDDDIERRTGNTVAWTFAERGETAFRDLERTVIHEVLSGATKVVALGGGALLDGDNLRLAESTGLIVTLTCSSEEIERRVGEGGSRPLLTLTNPDVGRPQMIETMLKQRSPIYDVYPTFSTEGKDAELVAASIVKLYRSRGASEVGAAYVLNFPTESRTMVSFVNGHQGNGHILRSRDDWPWKLPGAVVVTDETVKELYLGLLDSETRAACRVPVIAFTAGEHAKSLDTARAIYTRLRDAHIERGSVIVGLGGGVVCDVAGFVAATYLRGLDLVLIPTTLLAQVDAAIGGKTGLDFDGSKNLIGAFHPARQVFVSESPLQTLSGRSLREGLAEMVKIAFVRNPELLEALESLETVEEITGRQDLIRWAVRTKIEIVISDPYEQTGERALLNFGHTIGHAVESVTDYTISHGECVAIGMVAEARLAQRFGLTDEGTVARLQGTLGRIGLPTRLPPFDPQELLGAMRQDKKREGGNIRMVMIARVGEAEVQSVEEEDLLDLFRERELAAQ